MKAFLKIFGIVLICLIFLFCYAFNCFALIECDGNVNAYEWEDAEQVTLFSGFGHSGCCYHSATVKFVYTEEERRVYLALFLENANSSLSKVPENTESEIYVSFNSSSEIIMNSSLESEYNEDEFLLKYGYFGDSFGGGTYEAEIVLKELDFYETISADLSIRDYNGDTSQTYRILIKSEEEKESESESQAKAEKEKTTKNKSKKSTSKKKRSRKSSSRRKSSSKTSTSKASTTQYITAVLTENYESYSSTVEKNNKSILAIGVFCVVSALAAVCLSAFKKNKNK